MSYDWITPKTDWTASTPFTYSDYNRIRNNLLYLNDMFNTAFPQDPQILDLGDAKTGYTNNYKASEFNAFEDALISFTRIGEDRNIGTRSYYKSNGNFANFNDLNRIESSILAWKNVSVQIDYEEYKLPYFFGEGGCAFVADYKLYIAGGGKQQSQSSASKKMYWCKDTQVETTPAYKWFNESFDLPYSFYGGEIIPVSGTLGSCILISGNLKKAVYTVKSTWNGSKYVYSWYKTKDYPTNVTAINGASFIFSTNSSKQIYVLGGKKGSETTKVKSYRGVINTSVTPSKVTSWTELSYPNDAFNCTTLYDESSLHVFCAPYSQTSNKFYVFDSPLGVNDLRIYETYYTLPHPNDGGRFVKCRNNIYYIGGSTTDKGYYKLTGTSGNYSFTKVGELPRTFKNGAVVAYNNYIYVIGGGDYTLATKDDYMYKLLTY